MSTAQGTAARGDGVIHDLAYRRYEGDRRPAAWRSLVIARYALLAQWRQSGVRFALLAALLFAVIAAAAGGVKWGVTSMVEREVGAASALARALASADAEAAVWALRMQLIPTLLLALQCGAPAISADLNAGAFQFHFARPVSTSNYLLGRLLGATAWAAVTTLATLALLCAVRAGVSGRSVEMIRVFALAVGPALGRALGLAALSLGVSSLTRRRGIAQAMFVALVVGPALVGGIVSAATRQRWISAVDVLGSTATLTGQLLGDARLEGVAAIAPGAASLAWIAAPLALAGWRLSRAEVVRG